MLRLGEKEIGETAVSVCACVCVCNKTFSIILSVVKMLTSVLLLHINIAIVITVVRFYGLFLYT